MFMGINLSASEWCRKATPEVPFRTQGFSHNVPRGLGLDSNSVGIARYASHALDIYYCAKQR